MIYSNGYIHGTKTTLLNEPGPMVMWKRGGFFVDSHLTVHRNLQVLVDNCREYNKNILLFSRNGVIRDDVFWTSLPNELFWKQCMDLQATAQQHTTWANAVDTVYRSRATDPTILVINEHQSNLFFT